MILEVGESDFCSKEELRYWPVDEPVKRMSKNDKGSTPGNIQPLPTCTAPPAWAYLEKEEHSGTVCGGDDGDRTPEALEAGPTQPHEINDSSDKLETAGDDEEEFDYPEGGLEAWLVTFGAFCVLICSFGMMNIIGIFQAYLSTHQLKNYNESTISWIFSVYVFLAFFCGLQIGPIFDARGPKMLVLVGSVMIVASMLILGSCTRMSLPDPFPA